MMFMREWSVYSSILNHRDMPMAKGYGEIHQAMRQSAERRNFIINNNFSNKLVDQQIKLYLQSINKNNNATNNNNTNRINLYCRNQMHYYYKLDEQAITNIVKNTLNLSKNKNKSNLSSITLNLKHQTLLLRITPIPLKYTKSKPM